ncbi:MAG TPA: pilus assembly protein N-terminal domain-containing protein [Bryobacteraceae bacterium]|nr:pilus assembly protein N-terminal domain-containing protein [Bryobacteraceae bacterium]
MIRSSWLKLSAAAAIAAAAVLGQSAEDLRLTVGKTVVIDYPTDVKQILTSDPGVVDYSAVTTREIVLNGKGMGSATMVVWAKDGQRTFYNVNVEMNLDPLRKLLKDTFPREDIEPHSSRDTIALNGHVSSKAVGDQAIQIAGTYGKTVINNLQVAAPNVEKQILLRVRFAQLDRNKEQQFGVNLFGLPGQTLVGSSTGQFSNMSLNGQAGPAQGGQTISQQPLTLSQALTIFAFNPKLNLGAFIKALEAESVLQILAEPNLVTTNGKEASFLSGGQFPVPVLQGGANAGAVTVQFKEFGILLRFLPILTEHGTIKMHLFQEVSTLDTADGVVLNGFSIPALATRKAETDIELAEGQSFVVAGLVNNQEQDTFNKIPVLGSLPIFGALFKSKDEQKQRTDLLLVVTPEITQPLNPSQVPNIYMPRDFLVRLKPEDMPQGKSKKN